MASFEYNPLADSVTVKYECPKCHHVNVDTFGVPFPYDTCSLSYLSVLSVVSV